MATADSLQARALLVKTMQFIHFKGWAPGTGGNFSIIQSQKPLRLLMSPSSVDKGSVKQEDLIVINEQCEVLEGSGKASAEALLHVVIAEERGAGSILHTHSVWNTLLSRRFLSAGKIELSGYEMLKALTGNTTHELVEVIPVFENSQDIPALSKIVRAYLKEHPSCKAFLLSGHGLYTWGSDVYCTSRHVEALEFLFEVYGREHLSGD